MDRNAGEELPVGLERVRAELELWRERRRIGERIPKGLWRDAARASRQYGVNRVSKALGLDYNHLKRRSGSYQAAPEGDAGDGTGFVEVKAPSEGSGAGCIVELQKGNGARMRICVREAAAVDWGKLKEAFLGA